MPEHPWRDSARPVRLYVFDARLLALALLWVIWPSLVTTAILVAAFVALRIAEARGYRLAAAGRALRVLVAGRREALSPARVRRFTDFG